MSLGCDIESCEDEVLLRDIMINRHGFSICFIDTEHYLNLYLMKNLLNELLNK